MSKVYRYVQVSMPLSSFDSLDEMFDKSFDLEAEAVAVGGHCSGSGTGFGYRDMEFDGPDLGAIEAAIKDLLPPGSEVRQVEWTDEFDEEEESNGAA